MTSKGANILKAQSRYKVGLTPPARFKPDKKLTFADDHGGSIAEVCFSLLRLLILYL